MSNQNQRGSNEKSECQDVESQKAPSQKEEKGEEKKLIDLIAKLEQRCDLLSVVVQQQHKGSTSKVDSLLQRMASSFADELAIFRLSKRLKVPDIPVYT
jgi:hypothetical protein